MTDHSVYSPKSLIFHWLGALAVIGLFFTHDAAPGSRGYLFHVGGGAILGLFLLWRVGHRMRHGLAPRPPQSPVLNLVSLIVLWGILINIALVCVTGYLVPWSLGQAIDIYGILQLPSPIAGTPALHQTMEWLHDLSGHLFVPLIGLHLAGAGVHAFIKEDGVAGRMVNPKPGGK